MVHTDLDYDTIVVDQLQLSSSVSVCRGRAGARAITELPLVSRRRLGANPHVDVVPSHFNGAGAEEGGAEAQLPRVQAVLIGALSLRLGSQIREGSQSSSESDAGQGRW